MKRNGKARHKANGKPATFKNRIAERYKSIAAGLQRRDESCERFGAALTAARRLMIDVVMARLCEFGRTLERPFNLYVNTTDESESPRDRVFISIPGWNFELGVDLECEGAADGMLEFRMQFNGNSSTNRFALSEREMIAHDGEGLSQWVYGGLERALEIFGLENAPANRQTPKPAQTRDREGCLGRDEVGAALAAGVMGEVPF